MSGPLKSFTILASIAMVLGFVGRGPVQIVVQGGSAAPAQSNSDSALTEPGLGSDLGSNSPLRPGGTSQLPPARPGLKCARGQNGGATDKGVTANEIKLATTMVQSGPAASLLQPAVIGMRAVIGKVNAAGGICGRRLTLRAVDDAFRPDLGHSYIKNFIAESYFALPVVPSAEGLGAAIKAGDIERAQIPVIGTDGMRRDQYTSPWVWPVGAATRTVMRVMARYGATKKGAKTFAVVWDSKYKFGIEGATAFKDEIKGLGGRIVRDQPLDPEQSSYATEAEAFNRACGNGACDMVAMLLLPDTAKKWLGRGPEMGRLYTSGAQTLFTRDFANSCVAAMQEKCHGIAVWSGYTPPIGRYASLPDVAEYEDDVKTTSPGADTENQFLEGSYLGMKIFVQALQRVGPDLTRARMRAVLDATTFDSDLASRLTWRPGNHCANLHARSFSMVVAGGVFNDWRDENTGWIRDPKPCGS